MGSLRVVSSTRIHAPSDNNGNSTQIINLTPWDLKGLQTESIQQGLLFQHNPLDTPNKIQHLKHSLSSTLSFFPLFAGQLIITNYEDNTATCSIACNNVGALFVHADAENTTISDILKPNKCVPTIVHSLFSLNGVNNFEGTIQPLLAVQVTELVDGIFIGLTVNHVVADGKSFWLFVNSWSEISRGLQKPSKIPTFERWSLNNNDYPIRFPLTMEENKQKIQSLDQIPSRFFHFTREKIAELKSKANAEASLENSERIISSLQALLAHVWRSVVRCDTNNSEENVYFLLLISARTRLIPPLEEDYFGNTSDSEVVTMKVREILEGDLGNIALELNKVISLYSDEKIKNQYKSWLRTPQLPSMGILTSFTSKVLMVGNSPRFNVYGNDFGWGKPVAVRCRNENQRFGLINLFPGPAEGSIDIEVVLPNEILEAMGDDSDFLDNNSLE